MNADKKNIGVVNDEVEELLNAAEDAALLKFNVNAHTVSGLSSDLLSSSSLQTSGQGNMKSLKKKNRGMVNDEVEELLRAAEDAALLKLTINAHSVHGSSSDLDPNVNQRYQALKSGSKTSTKPDKLTNKMPPPEAPKVQGDDGEDDLFARFAALKASLPKPSPCTISCADVDGSSSSSENAGKLTNGTSGAVDSIDDEDEDEVENVIRWAMDAARLDSYPLSDEEGDSKDDDCYDDSGKRDEEDDGIAKNRKV